MTPAQDRGAEIVDEYERHYVTLDDGPYLAHEIRLALTAAHKEGERRGREKALEDAKNAFLRGGWRWDTNEIAILRTLAGN